MYIKTTGEIFEGTCDIKLENCKAKEKGIVSTVFSPNEENKEIKVCNHCLNTLLKNRIWNIRGASVAEMKKLIDIAIVDHDKKILIAFELKNWKEEGVEKGLPWAERMKEMTLERMKDLNAETLIIVTYEGFYIFREFQEICFINLQQEFISSINTKNLLDSDIFITEKTEFTRKPELVDLKHDRFIEIIESFIKDDNTLKLLPIETREIIKANTIIKKHTL
jgi:hypothetical protein